MYWKDASEHSGSVRPDGAYFGLTISSMGLTLELMERCGMVYPSEPEGQYPLPSSYGLDPEKYFRDDPETMASAERAAYEADKLRYLASGVIERPGIAEHKLSSNDGWVVTPMECRSAVLTWEAWCVSDGHPLDQLPTAPNWHGELVELSWWTTWINWLDTASTHEGFLVW